MEEVLKKKIIETVDDNRDDIIKLVQDMVKIDSAIVEAFRDDEYECDADYTEIVNFVSDKMREYRLDVELIGRAGKDYKFKMPSGTLKGTVGKPKLWFLGHLDTMPVGPRDTWDFEPFSGEVREGKILGRGAADNKSNFASGLILPKIFSDAGVKLKGDMIVTGCLDEEIANLFGKSGIWHAVDTGEIKPDFADWCIYIDGSLDTVNVNAVGVMILEITAYDPPLEPQERRGVSSINKIAEIVLELQKYYLDVIKKRKTKYPVGDRQPWPSFFFPIISGGWKHNAPPQKCTLTIERRYIPEEYDDPYAAKKEIVDIIDSMKKVDPDLNVDIKEKFMIRPFLTPNYMEQPITKALLKYIEEVKGIKAMAALGGGAGPERHKIVLDLKMPLVSHACFRTGENHGIHGPNEFIWIDDILDATKIHALAALELLG